MKATFYLIVLLFGLQTTMYSQKDSASQPATGQLKQFWMVILKTGPQDKAMTDTATRNKLFSGHIANMQRLYKEGILKAAGPFGKNDLTWRGLFILDCQTRQEAEEYLHTDPAIKAGIFVVDIVPWYSEAVGSFVPGKPVITDN